MLPVISETSDPQSLTTNPNHNTRAGSPSIGADDVPKRYLGHSDPDGIADPEPLIRRTCCPADSDQAADCFPLGREKVGGKGMFLQRMKKADLPVPPFKCVTAQVMNAFDQHPLDRHRLDRYLQKVDREPEAGTSLTNIREYLNTLLPSERTKRNDWLAGLAEFIVSDDYYEQVKDSEAARQIRDLRRQLDRFSMAQPIIVRSSGINEDNYGDAQAGKYLSLVQEEEDILRTCLKVMASGYRPEVCREGIPQPMALIIQNCVDCQYGGVAMSFQSFQDDTVRVEYTRGQPRGVVAGQSGNTPHRIDIYREDCKEAAAGSQYFPGTISIHFILQKNNNGYSETRIDHVAAQSDDGGQKLTDEMVSDLRKAVTELENLLLCPVDVEFAIDKQGRLFLLQVRPITQLSGGMDFAMSIPKKTLAIGEGISEGYCTGPLWLARKQEAGAMPDKAIVVAQHTEDWMLESGFLMRAGGFVIAEGGFNDHVAILMRQEKKPLMLAGGHFDTLAARVGQQTTLACGRFKGKPRAFIVADDLSEELASHRSLSSAFSDAPSTKAFPSREALSPSEGTFRQVASGFQWLTDQNARLLALFAPGSGLDYLVNPIKLSMSPQRSKLLAETRNDVNRLIYGAEALLAGYQAFLQLAGQRGSPEVRQLQEEWLELSDRFEALKQAIQSGLEKIIKPMQVAEDGQLSPGMFRPWIADCHQLKSFLQALNPQEADLVRSVHELIFALHQRFVKALAPVTLASGQGRISGEKNITYVDCTTPGEEAPLLRISDKVSMEELELSGTVISMDEAVIVNLELGSHVGIIELLEQADGGKGRTLRLTFSDKFDANYDYDRPGKFRRMWFLAQLLREIELDKDADNMKLSCNAVAGEMIVECPRMKLRKTMQYAFAKLIIVLRAMFDLDLDLNSRPIFEGGQWDFNLLAQRLNRDVATESDRFAFQHCLFIMAYRAGSIWSVTAMCCQFLSTHHQQFAHHARRLGMCRRSKFIRGNPWDAMRERLMKISENTRTELLHHLLLLNPRNATRLIEQLYDLENQCFVINPSYSYRLEFYVPPGQPLGDHKEEINNALLKYGLRYASQRVRNDRDFVLPAISRHPEELQFLSAELRNDRDVVMASAAEEAKVLSYASNTIRSDKSTIESLMAVNVNVLKYGCETLLSDREFMLDLIAKNYQAFQYVALELKTDTDFINEATLRNPLLGKWV
ncbi:PEP/pyruvate-binding domain-containing protein [Endozoicomonas sp. ALC020]|uniref:PEP/pyruvate-binding domain-containing protein n=1 Tax=unclassified Endozoicomonas TaxID=2644528 RepID=UPI003BAE3725